MGPMGHTVPNMMGVDQRQATEKISELLPGYMYMPMGSKGMGDMQDMAQMGMAPPENTLPMMSGNGPYGPIEMGGMFTLVKIRADTAPAAPGVLPADPGWYAHPEGTTPWEVATPPRPVARWQAPSAGAAS